MAYASQLWHMHFRFDLLFSTSFVLKSELKEIETIENVWSVQILFDVLASFTDILAIWISPLCVYQSQFLYFLLHKTISTYIIPVLSFSSQLYFKLRTPISLGEQVFFVSIIFSEAIQKNILFRISRCFLWKSLINHVKWDYKWPGKFRTRQLTLSSVTITYLSRVSSLLVLLFRTLFRVGLYALFGVYKQRNMIQIQT